MFQVHKKRTDWKRVNSQCRVLCHDCGHHVADGTIGRKEGNVLFNDALNTFYLRLYGVIHMVKDHSDSERKPAATTWATLSD